MPRARRPAPHCGAAQEGANAVVTTGVVTAFDEAAGLGTITADDGAAVGFQCTQIADGTRTIAVGTAVSFELRPWHLGRYEATAITPRSGS
jgi:cold shock CspA family protein